MESVSPAGSRCDPAAGPDAARVCRNAVRDRRPREPERASAAADDARAGRLYGRRRDQGPSAHARDGLTSRRSALRREQRGALLDRNRRAEEIALPAVAPLGAQEIQLLDGLDRFRDDGELEAM